jgi:SAM-dependent methyltransferase
VFRVVDAGCGAGQELLPYLSDAHCVGIDVDRDALGLARDAWRPGRSAAALCAAIEALPLQDQSADVVVCRLVLQRVDVRRALAEMARILRPGGGVAITFHAYGYYAAKLRAGVAAADLRPIVYALRVMLTGLVFDLSGSQREVLGMAHVYLTRARLCRMAAAVGLHLIAELPPPSTAAPTLLFRRIGSEGPRV